MSWDLLPSPVKAACHLKNAVYALTSVLTSPNILSTPSGGTWRDRVLLDKLSVRMVFLSPPFSLSCPLVPNCSIGGHARVFMYENVHEYLCMNMLAAYTRTSTDSGS